jgi:hypothetical protein
MSEIQEFFAVTLTSVYEVSTKGPYGGALAKKIALHGESTCEIGGTLNNGYMIAICDRLIAYVPEGGGKDITSFKRKIEKVNTRWWGGGTSMIVALFETKEEALVCHGSSDLTACDPRWATQTLQVIEKIGENHPAFEVCRWPPMTLPLLLARPPESSS